MHSHLSYHSRRNTGSNREGRYIFSNNSTATYEGFLTNNHARVYHSPSSNACSLFNLRSLY